MKKAKVNSVGGRLQRYCAAYIRLEMPELYQKLTDQAYKDFGLARGEKSKRSFISETVLKLAAKKH